MSSTLTANPSGPASVLLVDDQQAVRELLNAYLKQNNEECNVVAIARTGGEALNHVSALRPKLVITDIILPDLSILECLKKMHDISEQTKVIAFCRWINEEAALNLATAGVRGIVLKDQSLDHLQAAVRAVLNGACYFPDSLEAILCLGRHSSHVLTERESTALRLIAEGYATKQVGDQMQISVKTAEKYRERIMAKLKLHDVVSLTRYAIRHGFATL